MKSRVQTHNFRKASLSGPEARHRLLLAMAADAEKLRAQAERIKKLRSGKERSEGRRISQETAAHEIGVSSRAYRTWEGSGAVLKFENLKSLASYYDVTTSFIERGVMDEHTPELFTASEGDRLIEIDNKLDQLIDHVTRLEEALQASPDLRQEIHQAFEDYASRLGSQVGKRPPRSRRSPDLPGEESPAAA